MTSSFNILLIEDNQGDARLIELYLQEEQTGHYQTKRVQKLKEGLKMLAKEDFDAVLLDLSLPDSKGLDTFHKVRQSFPQLAILVLTGLDDDAVGLAAVQAGAQDFLNKNEISGSLLRRSVRYAVERKKGEEALKNEKEIAQRYLDTAASIFVVINTKHEVTLINQRGCEILGYHEDDILGKNWFTHFVPKKERKRVLGVFDQLMKGKVALIEFFENPVLTSSKKEALIQWHNSVIKDDAGKIVGALSSGIDMTERKQVQEALNIRNRALMATNNGVVISDADTPDGEIIYCNQAFQDMTGYSQEEILGRNCRFLQNDDRDQKAIAEMSKAIKQGKSCRVTIRNYKKDGTMFWNEVTITPIRDEEGRLTHFIGVQNDITERKKAEEKLRNYSLELEREVTGRTKELRDSQKLYSTIARNFPDGTINVFDRELRYIFVEGKELYALGIKSEMLMGTKYLDRLAPEVAKTAQKELKEVFKGKSKSIDIQYKNNDYILDAVPLPYEKGKIRQILVIEKNVTEFKRVQDQIKQALKKEKELGELKSRFVSMASHEFRTPLSTILSSASLIDRYQETSQEEKRKKHTTRIKASVNNLTGILNDFLSLDKLEAGKVETNPIDIDLAAFTEEICKDLEPSLKDGQKIDFKYQGRKKVYLDKQMLHNIQINLLSNAIKYSPENTTVSLATKNSNGKVSIEIKDQGIGIDEEDQKHLFQRFFRAKNATNLQGTGLGLNIVKKYVDLMGGSIKFSSKVNKGSTFTVTLPQSKK